MRKFISENDPDTIITEETLKREYGQLVANGDIDPAEETFADHLVNCLQRNNGTLEELTSNARIFTFTMKEITYGTLSVIADTLEEAEEKAAKDFTRSGFDCCANVEYDNDTFYPCDICGREKPTYDRFEPFYSNNGLKYLCWSCAMQYIAERKAARCPNCNCLYDPGNGYIHVCPNKK